MPSDASDVVNELLPVLSPADAHAPRAGAPLAATLERLVPHALRARLRHLYYRALPESMRRATMAGWFRVQAQNCRRLNAPMYADLLTRAARDIELGGPCWAAMAAYAPDPAMPTDLPGLRFMAAVHRLVLEGRAPGLAAHYASRRTVGTDMAWNTFRGVVASHRDAIRGRLHRSVQTNEVGRCRALVGGFLSVARDTGLPLRLLELGSSGGLNLRWDHYRYEADDASWGPADSPVRFVYGADEVPPPLGVDARVVTRLGCDLAPSDPGSPEGQRHLLDQMWADQHERMRVLRSAFDVARHVPVTVERAEASQWLAQQLASQVPGVATVVFNSVVFVYLPRHAKARVRRALAEAGQRAHAGAPLAWLQLEQQQGGGLCTLRLTTWPGGTEQILAVADMYGDRVRWLHGRAA